MNNTCVFLSYKIRVQHLYPIRIDVYRFRVSRSTEQWPFTFHNSIKEQYASNRRVHDRGKLQGVVFIRGPLLFFEAFTRIGKGTINTYTYLSIMKTVHSTWLNIRGRNRNPPAPVPQQ